jgi:hypothetical protein
MLYKILFLDKGNFFLFFFENFNIPINNIISVEAAKVPQ